jgi:hypothetical protein
MRKAVWVGAVLFTLLVVGVLVLFLVDFDSPTLGARLLREVSARAGIQITAEGFHLNLARGLRLDKVRLVTESPSGRLTVTADGLLAEHRLAPLLRGKVEVDRVILYTPRIELVTPPTAGAKPPAPIPISPRLPETVPAAENTQASNIALRVGRIKLENGVLLTRTEGSQTADVEIRGLGVELRDLAMDSAAPTAVQAFSAAGDLRTAEILVGGLRAVEGAGQIKLGAGHFRLEKFNLKLPQGPFLLGEFDADLNRDPFAYRFACQLDPLDTNSVLTAGKAKGFGPGKLVFTARGTGTETRDMIGDGTLAIAAGQVPGSPVFAGIEAILGRARLTGSAYAPFTVRFHIERDRLAVEPFELRTSVLALGLHGWADLAGPVDLRIAVKAPRPGEPRPRLLTEPRRRRRRRHGHHPPPRHRHPRSPPRHRRHRSPARHGRRHRPPGDRAPSEAGSGEAAGKDLREPIVEEWG